MRYKTVPQYGQSGGSRQWNASAGMPPTSGQPRRYTQMHVTSYLPHTDAAVGTNVLCAANNASLVRPSTSPSTIVGTIAVGLPPTAKMGEGTSYHGMEPPTAQLLKKQGLSKRANTFSSMKRPSTSNSSADSLPPKQLEPLDTRPAAEPMMTVEGMQMGEEVLVEPTVAREPPEQVINARSTSAVGTERHINASRANVRKERKLELEVKRLQTLLGSTNKELNNTKHGFEALKEDSRRELDEANARLRQLEREGGDSRARVVEAEGRAEELTQIVSVEKDRTRQSLALEGARTSLLARENAALAEQLAASQATVDELHASVQSLRDSLTREEEKTESAVSGSFEQESLIHDLKGQQKSREHLIHQIKAALAEEASTSEKRRQELKETREDLIAKEAQMIDLRNRNTLMIEYISKICQPHFAVVKDESLQPVNLSGFQVTQGHVLVPLVLLLEGYSLLPVQLRSVIDEKSTKLQSNGIQYGTKQQRPVSPSYKDKLFSMMDDKGRSHSSRRGEDTRTK